MSQTLNVSDQVASVVSALIGLLTLLMAYHRFNDSRQREHHRAVVGQDAGTTTRLPSADVPLFLGLSRSQIVVQLGSIWFLAAALTLYGHVVGSYPTFLAGLVVMGVVIVASSLIAPTSEARLAGPAASHQAGQDGKKRWHVLIGDAAAVVLLAAVGYLLALSAYQRDFPVAWLIPAFAGASAVLGFVRTRRGLLASPRMVARSTGALTLGAIAALIVLFLSYGEERHWSTHQKLQSGHASGTVRQIADDKVQVTGSVVDDKKDGKSIRLDLYAQRRNAPAYEVHYTAGGGEGTGEPIIDPDGDPSTVGHTFPGATSISVTVCRNDDNDCTKPRTIWVR